MRQSSTLLSTSGLILLLVVFQLSGCSSDKVPRSVLQTMPANGDSNVTPSLSELSVTFSEEMQDGNWSWVQASPESFPQMTGQAHYIDDKTKNVLPVRLEPNKEYIVWINAAKYSNFRDKAGNSAIPYKLTFKTGPADG